MRTNLMHGQRVKPQPAAGSTSNRSASLIVRQYWPIGLVILTGLLLTALVFYAVGSRDWSVLATGISFTCVITVYLVMLVGRTNEIERTVIERTADLEREISHRKQVQEQLREKNEELIATQEELRQVNQNLEQRVRERTAAIEKLLKQKEDLIAQLGHDLRSPLTPLVGLVPMLRDQQTNPKSKELMEVIVRNVDYMKKLVEKTLQLAKLNSMDDAAFDIRKVNLSRTVDEVIRRKDYLIAQSGIEFRNNVPADFVVAADKLRITEVFENLVTNAVKFMPAGGTLTVDAEQDGRYAVVSVRDTGIGLANDQLDNIFDEFYKADESRHDLESSGLGLAICRRIIAKHGGKIWAESEGLGKGSSFRFTIPFLIGEVGNTDQRE